MRYKKLHNSKKGLHTPGADRGNSGEPQDILWRRTFHRTKDQQAEPTKTRK